MWNYFLNQIWIKQIINRNINKFRHRQTTVDDCWRPTTTVDDCWRLSTTVDDSLTPTGQWWWSLTNTRSRSRGQRAERGQNPSGDSSPGTRSHCWAEVQFPGSSRGGYRRPLFQWQCPDGYAWNLNKRGKSKKVTEENWHKNQQIYHICVCVYILIYIYVYWWIYMCTGEYICVLSSCSQVFTAVTCRRVFHFVGFFLFHVSTAPEYFQILHKYLCCFCAQFLV